MGYGRAANAGAQGATAPWLLIANPDVRWCQPGALDALLAAGERWPEGGAFGPAIVTPDGRLYPSARALPSLGRGHRPRPGRMVVADQSVDRVLPAGARVAGRGGVRVALGSALLVRREAFESVGGFDPRYFMYFEDVDLCDRLGRAGLELDLRAVGASSSTAAAMRRAACRRSCSAPITLSAYRYLADRYRGLRWLPVRLVLRAGLMARYLLSRVSVRTAEGAAPTRSADLLDDSPRAAS